MVFLLESRSKRLCAAHPQKHHDAFVWKSKWPPGAEETQMSSSSNSRGSLLPSQQTNARNQLLLTVLFENGVKLCSCCGGRVQLCWRQGSMCSRGAAGFSPVSKVQSVYFETVTKSLLLSRQCCCCISTKHPPSSACLATLPCLCLSVCDGWEESDFLLQNYPSKSLPQFFLDQPNDAFLFQPHVSAVSQAMASFSGLWA